MKILLPSKTHPALDDKILRVRKENLYDSWNRRASPTPPTTEGWLPNFSQIYSELEKARENLNRRYLNNNDQSAGRSSRAVFSAMRLLDTARALLSSPRAEDVRREVWKEAARIAGRW